MSVNNEDRSLSLFISPDIRKFQGVENIAQYLKIKSRLRRSGAVGVNRGLGGGISRWRYSWSKSNNKLGIIIAVSGIIAVLIALATFVFTFLVKLGNTECERNERSTRYLLRVDVPRRADSSLAHLDPAMFKRRYGRALSALRGCRIKR